MSFKCFLNSSALCLYNYVVLNSRGNQKWIPGSVIPCLMAQKNGFVIYLEHNKVKIDADNYPTCRFVAFLNSCIEDW